ncbi:hypothetical protein [Rhizobium laguerreae]|uniref:hypothetical protein n=1 Tax=Rhizobium laguerreae TaxID=1076926 RepID=UPI001C8FE428|nr:hypothetical protein [Rhizobium laguerreae]MBY3342689.1 hypothetical protein [Rhizobium laguerreae]MBY3349724.1 hypothetical protein [Rhizobium laguerreae]MBY3370827.1 hypothetical protein [Rhizobium laguerreae]MBY3426067.1 hypothetical protein [Rhizobium laguerreae]MBY3434382.1 hypothetical protein [Rhizobium laguerreae]
MRTNIFLRDFLLQSVEFTKKSPKSRDFGGKANILFTFVAGFRAFYLAGAARLAKCRYNNFNYLKAPQTSFEEFRSRLEESAASS